MMLEAATLLLTAALTASWSWSSAWPPLPTAPAAPNYLSVERAVDNWRLESSLALDLAPIMAARLAIGGDLAQTPRCVKLNNYWCVKGGGWAGEIAADGEGHVAFARAGDGAAVAALLLRRYYIDYKRRSARAIVSRWAPARCVVTEAQLRSSLSAPPPPKIPPRKPESLDAARAKPAPVAKISARPAPPPVIAPTPPPQRAGRIAPGLGAMMPQRVVSMGLAPYGLENTLRARWLAAHGRGGAASPPKAKQARAGLSRASGSTPALEPAPAIAVGMGEPARDKTAELPRLVDSCAGERERIANYAARVIAGVVSGADDDLALFSADGAPSENLAKVMANMAAVEIGPLRASNSIIASGIAQMTRLLSAGKSAASTKAAPVADNAAAAQPRP